MQNEYENLRDRISKALLKFKLGGRRKNKRRIRPMIEHLEKYWNENPGLRLGQLISNLAYPIEVCQIEDWDLLQQILKERAK